MSEPKYRITVTIPAEDAAGWLWRRIADVVPGLPQTHDVEVTFAPIALNGEQVATVVEDESEIKSRIRNESGMTIRTIALELVD